MSRVTGSILYTDENGDTIEAEFAELSRDLQNGLLKSARIMLENQLELQAAEMERIDGITAELRGVAATSCISCDTRPPLWQVRASPNTAAPINHPIRFTLIPIKFQIPASLKDAKLHSNSDTLWASQ